MQNNKTTDNMLFHIIKTMQSKQITTISCLYWNYTKKKYYLCFTNSEILQKFPSW